MTWHDAAQAPGSTNSGLFDGGFSWGLVPIAVVALLALIAVCTFGVLARVRERAADRRSLAALHRPPQPTERPVGPRSDTGRDGLSTP